MQWPSFFFLIFCSGTSWVENIFGGVWDVVYGVIPLSCYVWSDSSTYTWWYFCLDLWTQESRGGIENVSSSCVIFSLTHLFKFVIIQCNSPNPLIFCKDNRQKEWKNELMNLSCLHPSILFGRSNSHRFMNPVLILFLTLVCKGQS